MARMAFHTAVVPLRTLDPANDTVQAGRYLATTLSTVDTDLGAGNIKETVNIFGKVGTLEPALIFTELAGNEEHTVAASGVWEDWDLSGIVPAGTKSVLVAVRNKSSSVGYDAGARKNGTALVRSFTPSATIIGELGYEVIGCMLTEVDANRVIDIYGETTVSVEFGIKGYWS